MQRGELITPPPIPSSRREGPPPLPAHLRKDASEPPPLPPDVLRPLTRVEVSRREQLKSSHDGGMTDTYRDVEVSYRMEKGTKGERGPNTPGEDALFYDPETGLGGVADGLGGEGSGDVASRDTVRAVRESYGAHANTIDSRLDTERNLLAESQALAMTFTNKDTVVANAREQLQSLPIEVQREMMLLRASIEDAHRARVAAPDSGKTTLAIGKTIELPTGERFEVYAQVGDSAVYSVKKDGAVKNLLPEHSTLQMLKKVRAVLEHGSIDDIAIEDPEVQAAARLGIERLTELIDTKADQLKASMYAAIGNKKVPQVHPFISVKRLSEGETIVYATDGIVDIQKNNDIATAVTKAGSPEQIAASVAQYTHDLGDTKGDDKAVLAKHVLPQREKMDRLAA